jgi:hypothetical protein
LNLPPPLVGGKNMISYDDFLKAESAVRKVFGEEAYLLAGDDKCSVVTPMRPNGYGWFSCPWEAFRAAKAVAGKI